MVTFGGLGSNTGRDYITRLKFLITDYIIDSSLTIDKINEIMAQEETKRHHRTKYTTKKSMSDFRSGLNKFYDFLNSNFEGISQEMESQEVSKVKEASNINSTEKQSIIQARVGQGLFRKKLINYWGVCSITGCNMKELLVASHIKPWRYSENSERIDPFNGLLLLPNFDKLFDKGYITVQLDGKVLISKHLPKENIILMKLSRLPRVNLDHRHMEYLEYHKENCFI